MNTLSIPQYTGSEENRFQETHGSLAYDYNIALKDNDLATTSGDEEFQPKKKNEENAKK